jgi:hypothetical protein
MGVVNTFKACRVFDIRVTFLLIPIWWGVKSTFVDKNSKDYNLLPSIMNEGLTSPTCFLSNFP